MSIVTIGFNPAIDRILECPGFHIGGHQHARQVARLASGKAANVSRALAHLGVDSIATGFVGTADLSFFHEQLLAAGPAGGGRILCHFVEVSGKTRENITILDPGSLVGGGETHLRDRGFTVTEAEIALLEQRIRRDLKPGDIAVFSGSLCLGLPDHYLAAVIDLCANLQAPVVVDCNGEPLLQAARKRLWLLKPNMEELQQLVGPVPDIPAAIRQAALPLLDTIEAVLISRGRNGAVLVSREACFSGHSRTDRDAVRTVTCGDHLLAGFVAERAAGRDLERSLRAALALATARALSPRLDEIDLDIHKEALDGVEIEKMA